MTTVIRHLVPVFCAVALVSISSTAARAETLYASSFEGASLVPFIIEEVLQRDEKEGAKASACRRNTGKGAIRKDVREKILRQILRFMHRMPATTGEAI